MKETPDNAALARRDPWYPAPQREGQDGKHAGVQADSGHGVYEDTLRRTREESAEVCDMVHTVCTPVINISLQA